MRTHTHNQPGLIWKERRAARPTNGLIWNLQAHVYHNILRFHLQFPTAVAPLSWHTFCLLPKKGKKKKERRRSGIDCKSEQDFQSIIKRLKLCLATQVPQAQVPRNKWQINGGEPRNTGGPPSWVAHITPSHLIKKKTVLEVEIKHKNSFLIYLPRFTSCMPFLKGYTLWCHKGH